MKFLSSAFMLITANLSFNAGSAIAAEEPLDTREVLLLTEEQREHVLDEMNGFLSSVQGIIEGIAENDLEIVAEAAAESSPKKPGEMAGIMKGVRPLQFKSMGAETRKGFLQITEQAQSGARTEEIASTLHETMNYCNACHATYQIQLKD